MLTFNDFATRTIWPRGLLLLLLVVSPLAFAQPERRAAAPSASEVRITRALGWMVSHAPVIFSGEVLTSDAVTGQPFSFVNIRVDQALRGVQPGEVFRLGQWHAIGGLRLQPHQRIILFLHHPNAAGLSSVVNGNLGLLTLAGAGRVNVRALEMFGAQVNATTEGSREDSALSRDVHFKGVEFQGRTRTPIRPWAPMTGILTEDPDTLPVQQIFTAIAALVQTQATAAATQAVHAR